MTATTVKAAPPSVAAKLAAPFAIAEVRWLPKKVKDNRALAIAYVDARAIQDRLDEVLGVDGWQDSYRELQAGSVMCRLRLRIGEHWITKADVGSPSAQEDAGDRTKAAFSDALKRAAVKFGIGRYLYRLPLVWTDYDPAAKRITRVPQLPAWALPAGTSPAMNQNRPDANKTVPAVTKNDPSVHKTTPIVTKTPPSVNNPEPPRADEAAVARLEETLREAIEAGRISEGAFRGWLREFKVQYASALSVQAVDVLRQRLRERMAA